MSPRPSLRLGDIVLSGSDDDPGVFSHEKSGAKLAWFPDTPHGWLGELRDDTLRAGGHSKLDGQELVSINKGELGPRMIRAQGPYPAGVLLDLIGAYRLRFMQRAWAFGEADGATPAWEFCRQDRGRTDLRLHVPTARSALAFEWAQDIGQFLDRRERVALTIENSPSRGRCWSLSHDGRRLWRRESLQEAARCFYAWQKDGNEPADFAVRICESKEDDR